MFELTLMEFSAWAGILTMPMTIFALIGYINMIRKRMRRYIQKAKTKLEDARSNVTKYSKLATNQGLRQDYYFYHESEISRLRFELLVLEIQSTSIHVVSFMLGTVLTTAIVLFPDRLVELSRRMDVNDMLGLICAVTAVIVLIIANVIHGIRGRQLQSHAKALSEGYSQVQEEVVAKRFIGSMKRKVD